MKKLTYLFLLLLIFPLFFISCEDNSSDTEEPKEDTTTIIITNQQRLNIATNKWLFEEMDVYYLWTDLMPEYAASTKNPQDYFFSLLYTEKDKWSYLAEDYKTWINSLNGISKSAGYSLALYWKDSKQDGVIAVVEFVYPNTPAYDAGLKRGDILGMVNGDELNADNYYDLLFDTDNSEITLGKYNSSSAFVYADTTITVVAAEIEENPVLHYEILEQEGKKIGYLVYVGFISNFNEDLNEALASFKEAGVNELVLDLRYNPGGDLDAANELCSNIAPLANVNNNDILVLYQWNTELQAYITDQGWKDNLHLKFDNAVENHLDLDKVYILTTGGSASASELTIVGLEAYMDVITIGETTHGKYAASITLPDEDSLWAIQPIVLKYANANGKTDFADGLDPDYPVEDALDYAFGDLRDPMLKKAVELIIGHDLEAEEKSMKMVGSSRTKITSAGRNKRIQDGILNIENPFINK